ncbi:MAG: hypothetical protein K2G04_10320 [Oscillospiraceae bacterium]|nr:hypothetical protein [Oscillospiraceae bacterium]
MMRVTDKMTTGTFLTNNRRLRSNLLGSYTRIMTQRRFNRVSEDSINGAKAMIIRRDLRDLDIYDSNLSSIKQLFTEAESSLTQIAHKNYISVEEQLVAATNGTHDQMEMNIFATTLDQIADSMVNTLNADFSERQIFGGTNNSTPPFEIGRYCVTDENDTVIYPPYFYDYYVGAEATQNQIDEANKALAKLAEYNANGTVADDKELTSIQGTLKKLGISLGVSESNKYSASVKTDNGKGEEIMLLSHDGQPTEITYSEAANPVIAEVETAIANINGAADKDAKLAAIKDNAETLAKLNLTASLDENDNVVYKDSKGINIDMTGGLPQDIKDTVPKEITVSAGADTISKQIENEVKFDLSMVDVPRSITYNGIPVDFDVMHKMTDANGNKFDIQIGSKYTIKKLNDDFTWNEGTEIAPNVEAAVKGRNNSLIFPGSDPVYVDIGIGMKYDKDNDYKVDPQTALDTAFNGAAIMGCGLDDDGYSKNLVQLVLDAARALRNGDQSTPNAIIDKANKANNNVLIEIANIGSKQNSIEFYEQRNEDSRYNLRERQNIVEGTDMETEISYFESLRAAYEASLKVGTQVIPNSIFNYI